MSKYPRVSPLSQPTPIYKLLKQIELLAHGLGKTRGHRTHRCYPIGCGQASVRCSDLCHVSLFEYRVFDLQQSLKLLALLRITSDAAQCYTRRPTPSVRCSTGRYQIRFFTIRRVRWVSTGRDQRPMHTPLHFYAS
jgi:hypothetical protein